MCEFAQQLQRVRTHCRAQLQAPGLGRDKVLSALLCIVDLTAVRVGNEEYARQNDSFGLTTLRKRHARVRGGQVELRFRGKSGIQRHVAFADNTLAQVVAECRALHPLIFEAYTRGQVLPNTPRLRDVTETYACHEKRVRRFLLDLTQQLQIRAA